MGEVTYSKLNSILGISSTYLGDVKDGSALVCLQSTGYKEWGN